jgi:phage terminase large subunit-like protein
VPDLLDTIKVHHVFGGTSIIGLKTYLSGREKFQGETLDWIWLDEECPMDIYTEALTRTNIGGGPVWMTFIPLLGMSDVVRRFLQEKSPDRIVVGMTIEEVLHYTAEERQKIIDSYPDHERECRTKGIPVLGSGRIFPVEETKIACEHRDFPSHLAANWRNGFRLGPSVHRSRARMGPRHRYRVCRPLSSFERSNANRARRCNPRMG